MSKVRHTLEHGLGLEDARQLALEAWEHYRPLLARNRPELEWQGPYRGVVKWVSRLGSRHACSVELRDRIAVLEMDIPLLARPFKEIGIALIEKELSGWLARFAARKSPG